MTTRVRSDLVRLGITTHRVDGETAIALASELEYRVIVVDHDSAGRATDLLQNLVRISPRSSLICLTASVEPDEELALRKIGVAAVIDRSDGARLSSAVNSVLRSGDRTDVRGGAFLPGDRSNSG